MKQQYIKPVVKTRHIATIEIMATSDPTGASVYDATAPKDAIGLSKQFSIWDTDEPDNIDWDDK